jgi:hypothetical protein
MVTEAATERGALGSLMDAALPRPISRANVARFTRFREEHAGIKLLELQACLRWILELFLTWADADGCNWNSVSEILAAIPRSGKRPHYARPTVLVALRKLRLMGLVGWKRVLPLHRFPRRGDAARPADEYNGERTYSGGRVWCVLLEPLRAEIERRRRVIQAAADARRAAKRRGPGTARAGSIISSDAPKATDRSPMIDPGSILHDRSSDSGSPSENQQTLAPPVASRASPSATDEAGASRPAASPRPGSAPTAPERAAGPPGPAPSARPPSAAEKLGAVAAQAPPELGATSGRATNEGEQTAHHALTRRDGRTLVYHYDPTHAERALAFLERDAGGDP